MPIKGITDRKQIGFPKIGDIRKGAAKEADRIGRDLTYFRAAFIEDETVAAAKWAELYPGEPRAIHVLLPFRSVAENFEAWQEEHGASRLVHRCDGETCVLWLDKDTGEYRHDPKPCPGGCKPTARLKVIIPELERLAYMVVHTTSINDIVALTENLEALARLTGNGINGIPLVLKRRPRMLSVPVKGKRARVKKWMLTLEADSAWVKAQLEAMKEAATPGHGGELLTIAEPEPLDELDADELDTTFVDDGPDWDEHPELMEEEPEIVAAEPVEVEPHTWTEGEAADLFTWTRNELIIADKKILEALDVSKVRDYPGDLAAAKAQINAWVTAQQVPL